MSGASRNPLLYWLLTAIALLCLLATMTYWAMQLLAPKTAVAPVSVSSAAVGSSSPNAQRLFGAPAAASAPVAAADSQIEVIGVATGRNAVALLTVDGKAAQNFTVGQTIAPGVRLQAVGKSEVTFTRNGKEFTVAAPAAPTTAILTAGKAAATMGNNKVGSPALPYPQSGYGPNDPPAPATPNATPPSPQPAAQLNPGISSPPQSVPQQTAPTNPASAPSPTPAISGPGSMRAGAPPQN